MRDVSQESFPNTYSVGAYAECHTLPLMCIPHKDYGVTHGHASSPHSTADCRVILFPAPVVDQYNSRGSCTNKQWLFFAATSARLGHGGRRYTRRKAAAGTLRTY